MSPRLLLAALVSTCLLSACGGDEPAAEADDAAVAGAEALVVPAGPDWGPCRIEGLRMPVTARLFVVDGATPLSDAEPGR